MTSHSEKDGGTTFSCDSCPEALLVGEDDFKVAWKEAEAQHGWKVVMVRGEWMHLCKSCGEGL